MPKPELSRDRIELLVKAMELDIKAHHLATPPHAGAVYEVLNALAWQAAITLATADSEAAEFFDRALRDIQAVVRQAQAAAT